MAGEHVRMIGAGILDGVVLSIAANADSLIVGTSNMLKRNKVRMFDLTSGALISSFGEEGVALVDTPCGLRFTPDGGHIVIAESTNQLTLRTRAGKFVSYIGKGVLNNPSDVDFCTSGDIIVADCWNHRVCVFSSAGGALLRTLGCQGDAPSQFASPTALATHSDTLYVLDVVNARVQVFH